MLSDGVFGFAITLLVLDLVVPVTQQPKQHLLQALGDQWPGYLGYIVSFATIGALWLGHNAITAPAERVAVTFYGLTLLIAAAVLSLFWRYALHARLVRLDAGDEHHPAHPPVDSRP